MYGLDRKPSPTWNANRTFIKHFNRTGEVCEKRVQAMLSRKEKRNDPVAVEEPRRISGDARLYVAPQYQFGIEPTGEEEECQ
jgi:hypothetical protein